jgi:ABC-type proline/glycine betaine transport system permease subunit
MTILQSVLSAYCTATLCFLLIAIFYPRFQKLRPAYLSIANVIAAVAASGLLVLVVIDLSHAWQMDKDHMLYNYRRVGFQQIIPFHLVACLLTFSPKLRSHAVFTLLLILIYGVSAFIEPLYIILTSFYKDYLPSSWGYYIDYSYLYLLIYTAIYFAVCYTACIVKSKLKRQE